MEKKEESVDGIVIVVGATGGVGSAVVKALAARGCSMVVIGRRQAALDELCNTYKSMVKHISSVTIDFADVDAFKNGMASLSELAKKYPIQGVVLALAVFREQKIIQDGKYEAMFLTNVLAPFCIVDVLRASLEENNGIIIHVVGTINSDLDFDDIFSIKDPKPSVMTAFGRTKLCNILMSGEWQRKYHKNGLTSIAVDPGFVKTENMKNIPGFMGTMIRLGARVFGNDGTPVGEAIGDMVLSSKELHETTKSDCSNMLFAVAKNKGTVPGLVNEELADKLMIVSADLCRDLLSLVKI